MIHPALVERITRSLAYMLRHKPEEFDLELDRHGFADLQEVVQALNERLGEPIEDADVEEAIEAGDRPRYEIREGRIRALYGHSIPVDPGQPTKPPELLFVGVGSRDAERARRYGLHGGRRRFLHLALTEDEALEMGRRLDEEYAVITVHALDAWEEEEVNFYDRRSVFLSDPIPKEFLTVGETRTDGEPPPARTPRNDPRRGRSGGDRNERGGRGRGRRGRGPRRDEFEPAHREEPRERDEDEPREPREPRYEPAARGERFERDRERGERSPGSERSDRFDRPRGDRGDRGERNRRREADAPRREAPRPDGPRPDGPRREAPARSEPGPRAPLPAAPSQAAPDAGAFGLGIFEEETRRAAPRPTPPPPPVERREPPRTPPPAAEDDSNSGSGFGAGL